MLVLVRHGRSEWNAQRRFAGRTDVALDDVGREQARRAGRALGTTSDLRSSPLSRATETAELLGTGLAVGIDDAFIELDYGELEGADVGSRDASWWKALREDPSTPMPGGESLTGLHARVSAALDELFEDPTGLARAEDEDVVVVSHVGPIKAAVAWALGSGPELSLRLRLDNGSLTRIGWGAVGPVVVAYNVVPDQEALSAPR